jgi:hypothetical protein
MITIYSSYLSSRLQYAVDIIFQQILGLEVRLTNQIEDLEGVVINYSDEIIDLKSFQIKPNGLLSSSIIYDKVDSVEKDQRDLIRIFPNKDDFGFDVFSAVFFLVSRMEEYQSQDLDSHMRFKAVNSILYQNDMLEYPVIDIWSFNLLNSINNFFNKNFSSIRKFNSSLTVDIDNAFAYKHKGLLRTFGASVKSLIKLDFNTFSQRIRVLKKMEKDPYDNYEYLKKFIKKENIDLTIFLLLADYAKYDKNLDFKNESFKSLIKYLSTFSTLGIHPSYNSYNNRDKMNLEINRLSNIISSKVNHSRNHFLRFKIPETFQHLISLGIHYDYSMGYADIPGFRAGTCTPFYFYDLINEQQTNLLIVPFAYMDGAFKDYFNSSIDESKKYISNLIRNVKSVNGSFISVWHNESLSNQQRWKGWREVFEHTFKNHD